MKFTPILGAHDENALCYLLEMDDTNILLDCGSSFDFSINCVEQLASIHIDAILLSHADMMHMGSLPMISKSHPCPVFATLPVQTLGQIALQDALTSIQHCQPTIVTNMHDIDSVCDKITSLRYSQPFLLPSGVTITAFSAGHSVGGSIWKIRRDGDDVVYAVDYNHKRESHLNSTALHTGIPQLTRPSLLITDSLNAFNSQPSRRDRDLSLVGKLL